MSPLELIDKYCPEERLHHILLTHSRAVADKALAIARSHPELGADEQFIEEAALLHDIGMAKGGNVMPWYVNAIRVRDSRCSRL